MRVTFIRHSCYFVELDDHCLLFDWYEGDVPETGKPLYVFASHSHGDHFSPRVFEFPAAAWFLSHDIFRSRVPEEKRESAVFVKPRQTLELDGLKIVTLKSTDAGVAFLVECEGKLLYHAGDLNCWVWDGAPKFQNDRMTAAYKKELELLRGRRIDAAFVPLDPRQEDDYDKGMRYFFEALDENTAQTVRVFPMHMWGDFSVVPRFRSDPANAGIAPRLMDVVREGQTFHI